MVLSPDTHIFALYIYIFFIIFVVNLWLPYWLPPASATPAQTYQQPSFSAKQASTSDSKASETTLSIGPGCSLVSRDRGQLPAMPLPVAPHDQLSSSCLLPNSSRLGVYIYICHNGPYSGAFSF